MDRGSGRVPTAAVLFAAALILAVSVEADVSREETGLPPIDPLWDFQHPDTSESRFRELLPKARQSGDSLYLCELLTQIARAQGLQRRFEEAGAILDEAEIVAGAVPGRGRLRCLLERGRVHNSAGRPAEALPYFVEAWDLGRSLGEDGLAVDAAHMAAIVETPDSALVWNHRALDLAQASPRPEAQRWLGSLLNNLGWTHHDRGEYETALGLFERALAWRQERGQERETRVAEWCVARTLRSLGRVEEALSRQKALHALWGAEGGADGFVEEEMGECLLALGRADEARPFFARAHEQLSKDSWLVEKEPDRLARLSRLGAGEAGR